MKNRKKYRRNLRKYGQKAHSDARKRQNKARTGALDHATGEGFRMDASTTDSVINRLRPIMAEQGIILSRKV